MKILKNISIFFLLIALTCCVVFGPQLISRQNEEKLLNEVVYRSYSTGSRPKPTGEQVARLYYNREISIEYNSSPITSENSDVETIRETVTGLVETMFGEDEAVYNSLKGFLADGSISYSRSSCLIKIDSQPVALNFVSYSAINGDSFFEILYEEKTKTVVRLSCDAVAEESEDTEDVNLYCEKAAGMMKNYFEKQLGLDSGQYLFTVDLLENGQGEPSVNIVLGCGIMQFEDSADSVIEGM